MWEAHTGAEFKLPLPEVLGDHNGGFAVVVQQERKGLPGLILGAAAYDR